NVDGRYAVTVALRRCSQGVRGRSQTCPTAPPPDLPSNCPTAIRSTWGAFVTSDIVRGGHAASPRRGAGLSRGPPPLPPPRPGPEAPTRNTASRARVTPR